MAPLENGSSYIIVDKIKVLIVQFPRNIFSVITLETLWISFSRMRRVIYFFWIIIKDETAFGEQNLNSSLLKQVKERRKNMDIKTGAKRILSFNRKLQSTIIQGHSKL